MILKYQAAGRFTHIDVFPPSSNLLTWQIHNALLILRVSLKYILQNMSEEDVILQLDGNMTVPQIASLENTVEDKATCSSDTRNGLDPLVPLSEPVNTSIQPLVQSSSKDDGKLEEERVGGAPRGLDSLSPPTSVNPAEIISMATLLSRQLVEGLASLLAEVPLL